MMPRWLTAVVLAMVSIAAYGLGFGAPQVAGERVLADRVAGSPAVPWTSPYIQTGADLWMAPALVRASAITVKAMASAASPRLLSIAFGAADVALIYIMALTLFGRASVAMIAALLLLFAPAHATFSRTAPIEGIWPVPFILIWAAALTSFAENRTPSSRWSLAGGSAALMLAAALQPTAVILVAVFGGVTLATAHRVGRLTLRDLWPAGLTAAVLALPIARWSLAPGPDGVSFARWLIVRAYVRNPHVASLALSRFWEFFEPSHLFLNPERRAFAGLFLAGMCVPTTLGAYSLFRTTGREASGGRLVVAAGCVAGPLAAALCGPPTVDARAISILPFGALLAGYGTVIAWRSGLGRAVILASTSAMLAQVWWLWYR
jgi:hypothetical protein